MRKMSRISVIKRSLFSILAMLPALLPTPAWAVDSYRWFHVTIDTPWAIFIFLLPMVVAPLVLLVVLYWWFALRPGAKNDRRGRRNVESVESSSNK